MDIDAARSAQVDLRGFLHGMPPLDPATFAGVVLLLALVALLACWLPPGGPPVSTP